MMGGVIFLPSSCRWSPGPAPPTPACCSCP
jgi:hypothetical protein